MEGGASGIEKSLGNVSQEQAMWDLSMSLSVCACTSVSQDDGLSNALHMSGSHPPQSLEAWKLEGAGVVQAEITPPNSSHLVPAKSPT